MHILLITAKKGDRVSGHERGAVRPGFQAGLPPAPYDILFEPVVIGPLVTKNRFFQVPHCNGMGYRDPSAQAAMRKVKAEGGWAVVSTEQVEIHPTSDITPFIELRIWDDRDLPALSLIAAAIHDGGALAAIELCHNGLNAPNLYSRETPLGPHHLPVASYGRDPVQARMMSKQDIADLRRWHRNAVVRSMKGVMSDVAWISTCSVHTTAQPPSALTLRIAAWALGSR